MLWDSNPTQRNPLVLIGTYTEKEGSNSEGIYVYQMDSSSGELTYKTVIKGLPNVSFMEVHPQSGLIYAVNETQEFQGQPGGGVSAIALDSSTNSFHVLGQQSSGGKSPCYISIEKTGRFALVANYDSGSVSMLPIQPDGRLSSPSDVILHVGSSVHPERQIGPHTHCIIPDRANRFAIAVDLGMDKLLVYRMDLESGKLHKHSEVSVEAGAGPRHLIFDSRGQYAFLLNELNSTVNVYRYDQEAGSFDRLQTISTLPADFSGENFCGDVRLSLDEKHLYASNRRHDSLACFQVDPNSKLLTYQSCIPSNGREPRIFALDPTGRFIIAVHQKSRNAVVYRIDPQTGDLSLTGYEAQADMPVHVLFLTSL
jgi:6-phosphogluconolactonase